MTSYLYTESELVHVFYIFLWLYIRLSEVFESVFSTNSDTKTTPDRCLAINFWKRQIEIDSNRLILQTLLIIVYTATGIYRTHPLRLSVQV